MSLEEWYGDDYKQENPNNFIENPPQTVDVKPVSTCSNELDTRN
jgi:hypothetical protein